MKIAVCDDELAMLKLISTYIRAEFEKHRIAVTVSSPFSHTIEYV